MNMNYTIDTVEDLVRILDEIAEQTKRFQAATEQRFDRMDQRLGRVEARLDRVIDDLGPLKGAHAGNVAVKEASLIALDLGLRYRKSLTSMELVSLSDAVDTTDVDAGELLWYQLTPQAVQAD